MTVDPKQGVQVRTVGELLDEDLRIPPYQRPYSWTPATALQLLDDLIDACSRFERTKSAECAEFSYVLGSVILYADQGKEPKDIVDGQQRLLTLTMLLRLLEVRDDASRSDAASRVENAESPVVLARSALQGRLRNVSGEFRALLFRFVRDRCELVRIETDDQDEAFRVFDSQNYRGKPLMPHDLLKAFHLRAMHAETPTMRAALVEGWESVDDDDLDRLFSIYLWRIRRWSRGLSAPAFAARHVDTFKGIRNRNSLTPSARYHRAAQAAVPMIAAQTIGDDDRRADDRSRFQLEAPVEPGRGFFEMVDFMRRELNLLRDEGFAPDGWAEFASSDEHLHERPEKSRYRYVSELYLAALLYYTNKFGDANLAEARESLFKWAFAVRVNYQRVQQATIQKRASATADGRSAFVLLRGAESPHELRRLRSEVDRQAQARGTEDPVAIVLKGLVG